MTAVLVVAKAPRPGQVKTRLAAATGDLLAAELAAAALLDTLEVCASTFTNRLLAVAGDLAAAVRGDELNAALRGWSVFAQSGVGFGERLAHAHASAFERVDGPVVQVGMDTPQVTSRQLRRVASLLEGGRYDAVLGAAEDGGWWVLAGTAPAWVEGLAGVPMSTPVTGVHTSRLLRRNGARVGAADCLRDVDTAEDARAVSEAAPWLRFSRTWDAAAKASLT